MARTTHLRYAQAGQMHIFLLELNVYMQSTNINIMMEM